LSSIDQRLQQNVSLNALGNIETVFGAVGAAEGEAEFFHQDGNELPTSSSLSYEFMKDGANLTSTKVKIFQLDKFARENGIERVDLMKIDTESTEPEVLRGAVSLLERSHPDMICEVLKDRGSERALEEILRPLGYKFYLLTHDGAVARENIEGHPEFLNYFFTKLSPEEIAKLYK
jgi:FkbM family methyltransferase